MSNKKISDPSVPVATEITGEELIPYALSGALGALQPKLFQRGLIKIVDLNGDFFTNLTTAKAYVATFNVAGIISNESFIQPAGATGGIYFFTVPENTDFSGYAYFLGDPFALKSAYIEDKLGLITSFGNSSFRKNTGNNILGNCTFAISCFVSSTGNNILGNCTFLASAFASSTGNNILGNCTFGASCFFSATGINTIKNILLDAPTNQFGKSSSGRFIINGNIGTNETNNYTNFFTTSTATIFASKSKYTSNAGAIEGDLALAQTNGATLFFEGINLVTLNTTQTLTNKKITERVSSITSSATPTPNADTDDLFKVTALAAAALLTNPTGTPTSGQILLVRIKDNGTARALTFDTLYRFSTDQPAPTTTDINKTIYLGFVYNSDDIKWDCLGWITNI